VAEGKASGDVRFLSDLFSDRREAYFIDDVHVTGLGNRLIAARMLPDVLNVIAEITRAFPAVAPPERAKVELGGKSVGKMPHDSRRPMRSADVTTGSGGGANLLTPRR
jgi:hypothetical protein